MEEEEDEAHSKQAMKTTGKARPAILAGQEHLVAGFPTAAMFNKRAFA